MSDARRYAVWPDPRSRSGSLKGSRPSVPHGTNFFLYNVCCFHDFIETSAPFESHWITYKNDVNTENCFQNGGRPPSWILENYSFGHVTDIGMWFFISFPNFASICRDIAERRFSIWRPSAILNLKNFVLSSSHPRNGNLHWHTNLIEIG